MPWNLVSFVAKTALAHAAAIKASGVATVLLLLFRWCRGHFKSVFGRIEVSRRTLTHDERREDCSGLLRVLPHVTTIDTKKHPRRRKSDKHLTLEIAVKRLRWQLHFCEVPCG